MSYAAAIIADSPIAFWLLNESSGLVAADSVGSNPGTYSSTGVTYGTQGFGVSPGFSQFQVPTLDGSSGYVSVPSGAGTGLQVTAAWSLEAMVWASRAPQGTGIIEGVYGASSKVMYGLGCSMDQPSGTRTSYAQIGFYNRTWALAQDTVELPLNLWQHLLGTWDGTTLKLYRNGWLVASNVPGISPAVSNDGLYLGRRHDNLGDTVWFPGQLGGCAIYNHALSAQQVAVHYAQTQVSQSPRLYVTGFPSQPVSIAKLGYNMEANFDTKADMDMAVAGGATMTRTQFSWGTAAGTGVENFSTGALALRPADAAGLAYAATKGVTPCIVAAYGAPYATVTHLTVSATTAAGSYTIPVTITSGLPLSSYTIPPYVYFIEVNSSNFITRNGTWAYYGSVIASVNPGAGTITLGAATNVTLNAGTALIVNQLRYQPVTTDSPTEPSNVAFARYAQFLGQQIASAGCSSGFVDIWNELPWQSDPWTNLQSFFDTTQSFITTTGHGLGILAACWATALPAGINYINGASDVSGFQCLAIQGLISTATQPPNPLPIAYEGIHPYGDNPEVFCWDPNQLDLTNGLYPNWYEELNPTADSTSNFRVMAALNDQIGYKWGVQPHLIATECGFSVTTQAQQAQYLLRRVISLWGDSIPVIIYSLNEGQPEDVAQNLVASQAYNALASLMAMIGRMTQGEGSPSGVPTIIGWPYSDIAACSVGIYGASGHACFFVWQRTQSNGSGWTSIPAAPSRNVSLSMPVGIQIAEASILRTGATVSPTISGNVMTVPITDEVVGIRLEPLP